MGIAEVQTELRGEATSQYAVTAVITKVHPNHLN